MIKKTIFICGIWLSLSGCAGEPAKTAQQDTPPTAQEVQVPAPVQVPAELLAAGKAVYSANCLACHQADGNGVPGLNPPLAGSEWVTGDKAKLVGTVLNGLRGPITVKGERYNGVMPQQSHLADADIAAALTYVRNSFGNQGDVINAEDVKAARK
jgi:mono/diheme cytochrome c family protein